jgi:serine/threonine protein kinase
MWSFGVILYILLGGYPPFYDADSQVLYRKIMKGSFQFHHDYWCNISSGAKDLIRNLLVTNPYSRYNVNDALNHPWVKTSDSVLANRRLDANLAQLKKFQATKKLRAGVKAVMAVNKMKRLAAAMSKGASTPTASPAASTATAAAPAAAVKPKSEVPHTVTARYSIGKVLGEGGYAVVKLGTSKITHDEVAIKIVDRKKMTKKHEDGLRVEVAILQSLDHPNIVHAIDFFEDVNAYYVIMELICGGELFDRIVKKTCYTEKEARDLVRVLLNAIKYMHDNNIVHR